MARSILVTAQPARHQLDQHIKGHAGTEAKERTNQHPAVEQDFFPVALLGGIQVPFPLISKS